MNVNRVELLEIMNKKSVNLNISDDNNSLFSERIGLNSVDMVYILMEISETFHIELFDFVPKLKVFSLSEILNCLNNSISTHDM